MKTFLDWSAYDTYGIGDAYSGIPATRRQLRQGGRGLHAQPRLPGEGRGVMCPSYRITDDPAHSTEARVAAFKAALNGDYGDDAVRRRAPRRGHGSLRVVQGLQEGMSERRRHGADQDRISGAAQRTPTASRCGRDCSAACRPGLDLAALPRAG